MIRLIAALDTERGIATDNGIPWSLPGDRAFFRAQTVDGAIVMGRSTYEEFAAPLHDRVNWVLTTRPCPLRDGFVAVRTLADVEDAAGAADIWVIGGASIYASTIGEAGELVLTQVQGDFRCTKFFPSYQNQFVRTESGPPEEDGGIEYRFERWRRRADG